MSDPAGIAFRPLSTFRYLVFVQRLGAGGAGYQNTCAFSGLHLINGGGRPEVQAAHIRPVASKGPDSVRNGLALTGTLHWLFDRGLLAVGEDLSILVSPQGVPDDLSRLLRPERRLVVPESSEQRPHPVFLTWHRENIFKV